MGIIAAFSSDNKRVDTMDKKRLQENKPSTSSESSNE